MKKAEEYAKTQVTAYECAQYRVEMTRRALMELISKVEPVNRIGEELLQILVGATHRVEALAEVEENELDEGREEKNEVYKRG